MAPPTPPLPVPPHQPREVLSPGEDGITALGSTSAVDDPRPTRRRFTFKQVALQVLAFGVGLALLVWCVHKAMSPENRATLVKLKDAPALDLLLLVGFSLGTLALNGASFWITLLPVRKLRLIDVEATNALAASLMYLPFKVSAISRYIVHRRRDHLPLMTITAWMGATGVILVAALIPPLVAAWLHPHIDWTFLAVLLAGMGVTYGATLWMARTFAHAKGLGRIHRMTDPLKIGLLSRGLRGKLFHNLHAGFAMMAHPGTLAACMLVRVVDFLLQAGRFHLAARLMEIPLDWEASIFIATGYFLIGVLSPAGTLGTREGGTTGLASLLHLPGLTPSSFTLIALGVSATEMIVNLVCGVLGLVWIRPDRLLRQSDP